MCSVRAARVNIMWTSFLVRQFKCEVWRLCPGLANNLDAGISGKHFNDSNRAQSLKLEAATLLAIVGWSSTCSSISDTARPKLANLPQLQLLCDF